MKTTAAVLHLSRGQEEGEGASEEVRTLPLCQLRDARAWT